METAPRFQFYIGCRIKQIVLDLYAMLFLCIALILAVNAVYGADVSNLPVNQQCLGCICEATSGCDQTAKCSGDVCGPFKITWAYWADAGKPTVGGESPEQDGAYARCADDVYCAALAVQGYMQRYQQDCNNDGKIDCDDFAAIHKFGGYGCKGVALPEPYAQRYYQCKTIVGNLKP